MNAPAEKFPATIAGYKTFELGAFTFARDEYFVTSPGQCRVVVASRTQLAQMPFCVP